VTALAQTVQSSAPNDGRARLSVVPDDAAQAVEPASLEYELVTKLATADDLVTGMARAAALLRRMCHAGRVEWWVPDEGGAVELVAADGRGRGAQRSVPLDDGGELVLFGGHLDPRLETALKHLSRIVRRRRAEERLARATAELARRNAALEDFAALVAHEVKSPLYAALVADDPLSEVQQALSLVDTLLEAAQTEPFGGASASAGECLEQVVRELGSTGLEITAELPPTLPLPPESLHVILRNLLANAIAARARHVHVAAERSSRSWRVYVDDDGVGLADADDYAGGSGLGFSLCRRIAARFGGALELGPRLVGGTRATLVLEAAS
jgi:signal transduction histidine kinase